uniref:Uncharacterized protein n=1 Tax=Peronospora matthiolae TaxID=2874970 RepID=A0AAV1UK19_9STRA
MKIFALAITALATVASVASAEDYQPALRSTCRTGDQLHPIADTLASDPTKQQLLSLLWRLLTAAANTEHDVDDDSKKNKATAMANQMEIGMLIQPSLCFSNALGSSNVVLVATLVQHISRQ